MNYKGYEIQLIANVPIEYYLDDKGDIVDEDYEIYEFEFDMVDCYKAYEEGSSFATADSLEELKTIIDNEEN